MLREIENWKNLVRFSHRVRVGFCYKRDYENLCERRKAPERKVVTISSQPGCRNSGKTEAKLCSCHEHGGQNFMKQWRGKVILSRIRDNENEAAWNSEPGRHFVQKTGQETGGRMRNFRRQSILSSTEDKTRPKG